jgi:type IV secretion system protein TrbL
VRRSAWWWAGGLIVVGVVAAAAGAQQAAGPALSPNAPAMGAIADAYAAASQSWLARLLPIAQRTFVVLAGIEVALSGAIYGLRRGNLDDLSAGLVMKVGILMFLFMLITAFPVWIPMIVQGFAAAGEQAIGATGVVNPSDVMDVGVNIAGQLLAALDGLGLLQHPATLLLAVVGAVIVLLAYMAIAVQLIMMWVESYIVLTGGAIMLGFAALRMTAGYTEGYLNYVVTVGIRIFLLYLVVAVGYAQSQQWVALLQADTVWGAYGTAAWQVIGGIVVFAVLVLRIPNTIASRITASPSFGIAAALRAT